MKIIVRNNNEVRLVKATKQLTYDASHSAHACASSCSRMQYETNAQIFTQNVTVARRSIFCIEFTTKISKHTYIILIDAVTRLKLSTFITFYKLHFRICKQSKKIHF